MFIEPAKSNVLHLNGCILTNATIQFAVGFGHALGKKVKLVGIGTPQRTKVELEARERLYEWYGI